MKYIDRIVSIFTDRSFIQNHWMQAPKVFSIGKLFLLIAGIKSLRSLIKRHLKKQPHSVKWILDRGKACNHQVIFPNRKKALSPLPPLKLAEYCTVILYELFRSNSFYNELCQKLAAAYCSELPNSEWLGYHAAAFVSLGKSPGFNRHRDFKHVFVFQHFGSARWKVYDLAGNLVLDHVLVPGEVLYIPILFEHCAERETAGESHVSLAIEYLNSVFLNMALIDGPVLPVLLAPDMVPEKAAAIAHAAEVIDQTYRELKKKTKDEK